MIVKKRFLFILLLTCLMMYIFTGCYFYPNEEAMLEPPLIEEGEVSYNTLPVARKDIENKINVTGYFVSVKQHDLSFEKRGGYIESINVKAGDKVNKGELLALLDNENLINEIKRQEIIYENALHSYELVELSHNNDLELANISLTALQEDLERAKKIGTYSKVELESKQNEIKKQQINIDKINENYNKERLAYKKSVDLEKLSLDSLKADLNKSSIISPASGRVSYIADISIGDYIQSRKVLIRVAEESTLQLQYKGEKANQFTKGMKVRVEINDIEYDGTVVLTSLDVPNDEKDSFRDTIMINIDNLPEDVEIGNSADISVVLQKSEDAIVIPKSVVQGFAGRRVVKVLEDDVVIEKDIETGIESVTEYEVISGLSEGELVIK